MGLKESNVLFVYIMEAMRGNNVWIFEQWEKRTSECDSAESASEYGKLVRNDSTPNNMTAKPAHVGDAAPTRAFSCLHHDASSAIPRSRIRCAVPYSQPFNVGQLRT